MFIFITLSIILGLFSSLIIYAYCQEFTDFISLKAFNNKFLSLFILFITMFLFLLVYYRFGKSIYSYICSILFTLLICLSIIDLKIGIVPDSINLIIFFLSIINLIVTKENITYHIIGFFTISIPFFIISILTNGIGGGDIKLFAVTGLFLGAIHIFLAMFICCLLASVIGLILKYLNKTEKLKNGHSIPLVPYISIGVIISCLYGDYILDWYISKFFY